MELDWAEWIVDVKYYWLRRTGIDDDELLMTRSTLDIRMTEDKIRQDSI